MDISVTLVDVACRQDPFARKDWYDVKAPSSFQQRQVGKTLVTRTQGTKVRPHCHIAFLEGPRDMLMSGLLGDGLGFRAVATPRHLLMSGLLWDGLGLMTELVELLQFRRVWLT